MRAFDITICAACLVVIGYTLWQLWSANRTDFGDQYQLPISPQESPGPLLGYWANELPPIRHESVTRFRITEDRIHLLQAFGDGERRSELMVVTFADIELPTIERKPVRHLLAVDNHTPGVSDYFVFQHWPTSDLIELTILMHHNEHRNYSQVLRFRRCEPFAYEGIERQNSWAENCQRLVEGPNSCE